MRVERQVSSVAKRLFDTFLSAIGLLVLSPLLAYIAWRIRREDDGPVFFRGVRSGLHGKPFRIFKFRSMVIDAEKLGASSTSGNDPRITNIGIMLRRYKLDELPQLINVLRGDMSLVGPRPEVPYFTERYTDEEKAILTLRPGITDWASIWNADEGGVLEGAVDADAVYEEVLRPIKIRLQLYYRDTQSLCTDIKILFSTLYRIYRKNWIPRELRSYPSFEELRMTALEVIKRQKRKSAGTGEQ